MGDHASTIRRRFPVAIMSSLTDLTEAF